MSLCVLRQSQCHEKLITLVMEREIGARIALDEHKTSHMHRF